MGIGSLGGNVFQVGLGTPLQTMQKFQKFHRKTRMSESPFNKVAVSKVFSFIKERLHHRCFQRRPFSQNTSSACLWNKLIWSNLVRVMILAKQLKKCMFLLLLWIGYWIFLKIDFYSALSNGSLAHKTKHYKGMLLIRTEKRYFKIN